MLKKCKISNNLYLCITRSIHNPLFEKKNLRNLNLSLVTLQSKPCFNIDIVHH